MALLAVFEVSPETECLASGSPPWPPAGPGIAGQRPGRDSAQAPPRPFCVPDETHRDLRI